MLQKDLKRIATEKIERESSLERKFDEEVQLRGGMTLKLATVFFSGLPDRLVILPGNRIGFAELKAKKGVASRRQKAVHALLLKRHVNLAVLRTMVQADAWLDELSGI